jgi:hypothetical protein
LHSQDRFLRDPQHSRAERIVDALDMSCCYLNDIRIRTGAID